MLLFGLWSQEWNINDLGGGGASATQQETLVGRIYDLTIH